MPKRLSEELNFLNVFGLIICLVVGQIFSSVLHLKKPSMSVDLGLNVGIDLKLGGFLRMLVFI